MANISYCCCCLQSETLVEIFKRSYSKCKARYPDLSKDALTGLVQANFETDNSDLKCFIFCIGSGMRYVDETGKFLLDGILEHPPPMKTQNQVRTKKCQVFSTLLLPIIIFTEKFCLRVIFLPGIRWNDE